MVKLYRTFLLCLVFLLTGGVSLYAQQRAITGKVQLKDGEALIGATVVLKNTNIGAISGSDGSFRISVPEGPATLVVSFMGFETTEVNVPASTTQINVILSNTMEELEEVVVVAFGTQRKVNVTGSVSTIEGSAILAAPVANISNALIGNTPGVVGLQSSGEPGHNSSDIRIRGTATMASTAPLIVIDGVEQASERAFDEFNSMDPNEIATINVLKDASSTAVYGIKAANGVIIVSTKRGLMGKPVINASANYGLTMASDLQNGTTSYEYALMRNEAIRNEMHSFSGKESLLANLYSDYDLWKFKNNRDFTPQEVDAMTNLSQAQREQLKNSPALYYANRNLYKEQFGKTAPQYQANINVSGGTERVKYFTSIGYFQQQGILNNVKYHDANTRSNMERYNYRSNFDIRVLDNLKISVNSSGQFGQSQGPGSSWDPWDLAGRYKGIMQYIYDANPFISPGIVDGRLISGFSGEGGSVQNPIAVKTNSSIGDQNALYNLLTSGSNIAYNSLLDNSIKIDHTMDYLLSGLSIRATASYQDNYNRRVTIAPSIPSYRIQRSLENPNEMQYFGGSISGTTFNSWGNDNWSKFYTDLGAHWANGFAGHNITALVLAKFNKYDMPSSSFNTPSSNIGYLGRVTYNYENKYMAEFNAGANGSGEFAPQNRYKIFPAVSAGWVLSAEEFFPKNDILTFVKIRGSYGKVGNDRINNSRRYLYLPSTYTISDNQYYLGNRTDGSANSSFQGSREGDIGYPGVTWETANKYDVGLELSMFRDRLTLVADIFKESRKNILVLVGTLEGVKGIPDSRVPPANVGETRNSGYEFGLSWEDKLGDFKYSIGGDITYSHNEVIYKAEVNQPYFWMRDTGFSIGQRHGYISDGFYNTPEELANRPYHKFCSDNVTLGDIRYKDLNGDAIIDQNDRAPIGYPNYPEYNYNVKVGFSYKGFSMRLLFTGTINGSYYLNPTYSIPFFKNAGNAFQWQYDGRWTPEKVANGTAISYPRATYSADGNHNNYVESDFWMTSSNFFKLKNIEVGYTFTPKKNWVVNSLRIYASGNNIASFGAKRLREVGIDPEGKDRSTSGSASYIYPLTRVFNLGVSMTF